MRKKNTKFGEKFEGNRGRGGNRIKTYYIKKIVINKTTCFLHSQLFSILSVGSTKNYTSQAAGNRTTQFQILYANPSNRNSL